MANSTVLLDVDRRGVAAVTFNRPHVNNAYNGDLIQELVAALDDLDARSDLRVVVLRGNGKHFQAGADLAWLRDVAAQSEAENVRISGATARATHRLNMLPVPTLALVQGGCFGGGTGFAAACDIVIAADDAIFSISETRWGLMAGIIIPQLCDAMGVRQVRRYALTGERFDAHEARRIGLVHAVVPRSELELAGERMVDQLLQNAPDANAQTKAAVLESARGNPSEETLARLVAQHAAKRRSAEAAEGLASFSEKRAARWYPRGHLSGATRSGDVKTSTSTRRCPALAPSRVAELRWPPARPGPGSRS
jgi:methylglutaconyl-CoA hydratase